MSVNIGIYCISRWNAAKASLSRNAQSLDDQYSAFHHSELIHFILISEERYIFRLLIIFCLDFIFVFEMMQRSVFGEDALVNVSVEKKEDNDGKLAGYIRIRSKTQGIALSLGDRITSVQRCSGDK